MEGLPFFSFDNPWIALIQLFLFYALPRLVGLVTAKVTRAGVKIALLGVFSVVASALTYALDFAITGAAWSTFDLESLLAVVVNAAITFALGNSIYQGVLKPTGVAAKDAANTTIQVVDK